MKQTAVEWLIDQIKLDQNEKVLSPKEWLNTYEQAKEMEKEQIEDAYTECWKSNMPDGYECKQSAEEHYNETYRDNLSPRK